MRSRHARIEAAALGRRILRSEGRPVPGSQGGGTGRQGACGGGGGGGGGGEAARRNRPQARVAGKGDEAARPGKHPELLQAA